MTSPNRSFAVLAIATSIVCAGADYCRAQLISPGWTKLDSAYPSIKFDKIECANDEDCIALARDGLYYRSFLFATTDGGASWNRVVREEDFFDERSFEGRYLGLAHPTPTTIVVICKYGWILSSTDAGGTWRMQQLPDTSSGDVAFADSFNGVLRGHRNLWRTSDGGNSWHEVFVPHDTANLVMGRVAMPAPDVIISLPYRRGGSAFAISSNDTGATWHVGSTVDGARAVSFVDRNSGWIAASRGTGVGDGVYDIIYESNDGGQTWRTIYEQIGSPPFEIRDLDFADELRGIASGPVSKLQVTTDGGATWRRQFVGSDSNRYIMYSVDYASPTRAFAVNSEGGMYRYDEPSGYIGGGATGSEEWRLEVRVTRDRRLVLRLADYVGMIRVSIVNASGELVYSEAVRAVEHVAPIELRPGLYFVRATDGERFHRACLVVP